MSSIVHAGSVTALDARSRYLPGSEAGGYVLGTHETVAEALHRVSTDQLTIAIDALGDRTADVHIATTAALTGLSRTAALLRLVRDALGDDVYQTEIAVIDDTHDLLRALQSGQAELRAIDLLRARYATVLAPGALLGVRDQVLRHHQLRRLKALTEGQALQRSLHRLRRSRARFGAQPVDVAGDATIIDREPVPDHFDSVAPGLGRAYRRCRRAWRTIDGAEPVDLARFGADVGVLARQLQLISSIWPEVLGATADAAGRLESAVGEARGLDLLAAELEAGLLDADPVETDLLAAMVRHQRDELTGVIVVLGQRLLAEPTRLFTERIGNYWTTTRS